MIAGSDMVKGLASSLTEIGLGLAHAGEQGPAGRVSQGGEGAVERRG